MKAFEFDHHLINSYARFSRSFSTVRPEDLKSEIDRQYDAGRFWPDALLSLNPRFLKGDTVDDLVASGDLDDATGQIFRFGDKPLRFHRHQAQSIAKARAGQSYVVTTGTGSGKSLCFFVPVVDAIIRRRKAGKPRGTIAIIVYPMNALANSQIKEIEGFISPSGLAGGHLIRFARGSEYGSDLLACHFQRARCGIRLNLDGSFAGRSPTWVALAALVAYIEFQWPDLLARGVQSSPIPCGLGTRPSIGDRSSRASSRSRVCRAP